LISALKEDETIEPLCRVIVEKIREKGITEDELIPE